MSKHLILIVDKRGILGTRVVEALSALETLPQIVFATGKELNPESGYYKHLIVIPYEKKFPQVPQGEYSHMLFIYSGEEDFAEIAHEFLEVAKQTKARLVFILPILFATEKRIHALQKAHTKTFVIVLGEVFGANLPEYGKTFAQLSLQAKKGKVTLYNMGMDKLYTVFIDDCVTAVLEVLFQAHQLRRLFYVFPKRPPTQLTITRILHKLYKDMNIDFVESKDLHKDYLFSQAEGTYLLKEPYDLEARIKQDKRDKELSLSSVLMESEPAKNDFGKGSLKIFLLLVVFIALLPLLTTFLASFLGATEIKRAKTFVEQGNFEQAANSAQNASFFFGIAETTNKTVLAQATFFGRKEQALRLGDTIRFGKDASGLILTFSQAGQGYLSVASGKSIAPKQDFTTASNALKSSLAIFQKLKVEQGGDWQKEYNSIFTMAGSLVDVLPWLFGFEGNRTYLILFQNNMELRPGGGFVGSYALSTVDKGRITDFSIYDVYDADGQLKGHVEPPYAIRRYIPISHWFLRDSNFSPDFAKNSANAAFFLKEETGKIVDGIIGIDASFVKEVLAVSGPVYVSSYNQWVSADNMYELTQRFAENDFFPGSTQKKNFLKSLFIAIREAFVSSKNLPYALILSKLSKGISERHVQFSVNDLNTQKLLSINNFYSSLADTREEGQNYINDFLSISEANVGGNKANAFIKRKVDYEVSIDEEGSTSAKLTITYKNTSKKSDSKGLPYKNYLRLFLPKSTILLGVAINGQEQHLVDAVVDPLLYEAKDFKAPTGLEIERGQEDGKTIFGFLTVVGQEDLQTIVISYILPNSLIEDFPAFSYSFLFYKQPGTAELPFSLKASYPQQFLPYKVSGELQSNQDSVVTNQTVAKDFGIDLSFSRK